MNMQSFGMSVQDVRDGRVQAGDFTHLIGAD